ncbi:hypothetical protein FOL47_007689 [Perkinsus chesapeaki]|uniref:Saccharopine dehydrogenase NADP binding domain-containing protein n=1 Tax=Perkinsus chesapeaki TaxID=330153 RepID=A0A7J6LIT9_PERCH|nr:hypothetical protein FOL47_007689 [Perkinsus chesapeaki]
MAKDFDVIVFGASGYAGAFVAKEMAVLGEKNKLKVGMAGRNSERIITEVKKHGYVPREDQIVVADVSNTDSIKNMVKRTRLVMNCVGPYRHFGETVVSVCAELGTDYMDLCGEPEFIEKMQLKYTELAKQSGAIVMNACAFDSVPADFGFQLMHDRLAKDGGIPVSVESFLRNLYGPKGYVGHYATYECAVYGMGSVGELREVRRSLQAEGMKPKLNRSGPALKHHPGFFEDDRVPGKLCMNFLGSDRSVVQRTQEMQTLDDKSYQGIYHNCYLAVENTLVNKLAFIIFGGMINFLCKYPWGRQLLLKYPKLFTFGYFSHEGSTMEQLEEAGYQIDFFGKGFSSKKAQEEHPDQPDVEVKASVHGPDPGYIGTSRMFSQLALVLLTLRDSVAVKQGGVYTAARVFRGTVAPKRLTDDGCAVFSDEILD